MRFSHLLAMAILVLSTASAHASSPRALQAPDARVYTNVDEYLDSYVEFARILKEHKSTNKSVVVTNSRAEIQVGSTNNYVMDVGFGIYSQLYADMLGFSDVFVSDELPEDILVMSFRQINWGTDSQCYLNIVFRRNPAAHLPDAPLFSSDRYIHHPTHAPQRSKTKKDDASIGLTARQKFDASLPEPTKKADYKNPRPWSISIATQDWSIPEKKGIFVTDAHIDHYDPHFGSAGELLSLNLSSCTRGQRISQHPNLALFFPKNPDASKTREDFVVYPIPDKFRKVMGAFMQLTDK